MAKALALGFLVGFPIAASPGPMFFLVLRRTLARGWVSGLISGLGVATGDAIYAALAAFGVAAVTAFLISERRWIGLVGGIAIGLIGLRILVISAGPHPDPHPQAVEGKERDQPDQGEGNQPGRSGAYVSTLGLTLGNPWTILALRRSSLAWDYELVPAGSRRSRWCSGSCSDRHCGGWCCRVSSQCSASA
jgi:threonine/homoserine/homoserine lactone efflux protein